MRDRRFFVLALALGCVALSGCTSKGIVPDQANKDLHDVQAYFERNHPGKKWESGPTVIDTEEIRTAYGQRRFYFVFSAPPTLPGRGVILSEEEAKLELEGFQQALAKFDRERLSVTVGIDDSGKVTLYQKAEDFNQGLMQVRSDQDAKVAAAAIFSLFVSDEYGQQSVTAKEVDCSPQQPGWNCGVKGHNKNWKGNVLFDAAGKCISVSRLYPVPGAP
jgi:hypothetical protein